MDLNTIERKLDFTEVSEILCGRVPRWLMPNSTQLSPASKYSKLAGISSPKDSIWKKLLKYVQSCKNEWNSINYVILIKKCKEEIFNSLRDLQSTAKMVLHSFASYKEYLRLHMLQTFMEDPGVQNSGLQQIYLKIVDDVEFYKQLKAELGHKACKNNVFEARKSSSNKKRSKLPSCKLDKSAEGAKNSLLPPLSPFLQKSFDHIAQEKCEKVQSLKLPRFKSPPPTRGAKMKKLLSEFQGTCTFNRLMFLSLKNKRNRGLRADKKDCFSADRRQGVCITMEMVNRLKTLSSGQQSFLSSKKLIELDNLLLEVKPKEEHSRLQAKNSLDCDISRNCVSFNRGCFSIASDQDLDDISEEEKPLPKVKVPKPSIHQIKIEKFRDSLDKSFSKISKGVERKRHKIKSMKLSPNFSINLQRQSKHKPQNFTSDKNMMSLKVTYDEKEAEPHSELLKSTTLEEKNSDNSGSFNRINSIKATYGISKQKVFAPLKL